MKYSNLLYLIAFLASFWPSQSQELPPVLKFSAKAYGADNQNWSITQTTNKTMFFANSNGLLHFDGEKWGLYDSPNQTILRSVFAVDHKVYSGAYMDFGVWESDKTGNYTYTSLSDSLNLVEDEQFWKIDQLDNYIVFQSLNSIYLYNTTNKKFKHIKSAYGINKMVILDNILYYHKINEGVFKQVNGKEIAVNTTPLFQKGLLINLYKIKNEIYGQLQYNGIVSLSSNQIYTPKNFKAIWPKVSVYNSLQTTNGDIYLGTISHGLIKLSNDKVIYQLNQESGLSNNTVLNLFEDKETNIWLALDNGINCLNLKSSLSIYNDNVGKLGTVYSSINYRDTIYLGTNQGVFYKSKEDQTFKFISETKGQVWSLFKTENALLCGHNIGSFQIEGTKATLIDGVQGTWGFKQVNDTTLLSGNYNGLHRYKIDRQGKLSYQGKIPGFDISTKYFEFIDSRTLIVNHEYKGLYQLKLDHKLERIIDVDKNESVSKGLHSSIIKYQDQLLYAFKYGVFNYNTETKTFVKNDVLSSFFTSADYTSGQLIRTSDDKIWLFSENGISILLPSSVKNDYIVKHVPINHDNRKQISGYENVSLIAENKYLLGNSNGYYIIDLDKYQNPIPEVAITEVSIKDKLNATIKSIFKDEDLTEVAYQNNNFSFHVTSFNYDALFSPKYQFKLDNYTEDWSSWQQESQFNFKNLPAGHYTFRVRSKIGQSNLSTEASFEFSVAQPFYLSNSMLALYAVLIIMLGFIVHIIYRQNYKKQKRKLQKKAQKELELKELEGKQEIMKIKNEKLQQDVESKNRELAISTMSLVKKNEFLSGIKKDLKLLNTDDPKLKQVLKTINKNLNSTDDWSFFEEAFNNADKDFLKKIKEKHPSLTPNDLKLCAYLRLNLSSKEIAPLFNISPRSVEVKRYRLRKKMNLDRNDSLTNYILEL